MTDRRYKIVVIQQDHFLPMFNKVSPYHNRLSFLGLPCDASVVNVSHDPMRGGILFLVYHESFDVVEEGLVPPYVISTLKLTSYQNELNELRAELSELRYKCRVLENRKSQK